MAEALEVALVIGLSYTEFWQMTPFEFEIAKKAYNKQNIDKYNSNMTTAYYSAYFNRTDKMQKLEDYIIKEEQPLEEMSDEQLMNQIKMLNAMLGGTITNGNG